MHGKYRAILAATFMLVLWAINVQAQTGTTSPYSRYGLGDLQVNEFGRNAAMGGIGLAIGDTTSPSYINFSNPASYSATEFTAFEAGVKTNFTKLENSATTAEKRNTNFSYFALAFPVKKLNAGISLGLRHYSNIGYQLADTVKYSGLGTFNYEYEGTGGLNQFYIGLAKTIFETEKAGMLSVGLNTSYMFGALSNIRRVEPDTTNALSLRYTNTTNVGGINLDFGMQYQFQIKNKYFIGLGLVYSPAKDIKGSYTSIAERYFHNDNGSEFIQDTAYYNKNVSGNVTIPMSWGGGISIRNGDKWIFGADYKTQDWANYQAFGVTDNLANSWKGAAGFELIPNKNLISKKSYLKRVAYRIGGYYSNTYLQLRGTQLTDYGITFGLGLPLPRIQVGTRLTQSIINIAVELGQRGTTENSLIKENYANIRIGFTLNDKWFNQRKYD